MADYISHLTPGLQIVLGFGAIAIIYGAIEVIAGFRARRELKVKIVAEVTEEGEPITYVVTPPIDANTSQETKDAIAALVSAARDHFRKAAE